MSTHRRGFEFKNCKDAELARDIVRQCVELVRDGLRVKATSDGKLVVIETEVKKGGKHVTP